MTYEMPVETGEQRLQRLRDRQHVWTQRGFVAAGILALGIWGWSDGLFDEGLSWSLLALPAVLIVYILFESVFEAIFAPVGWALEAIFRPIFRPLSSRGYSYYDEEEREERENPTPDYSRAERIPEEYR